jgi:hypothetical protein
MHENHLVGEVHSLSNVQRELPALHRFRVVIIDESHNLRNTESKRYQAIKEYIEKNECKCILLTATPYNKSNRDLSAQLQLFLTAEQSNDLGIRPERKIAETGEAAFASQSQQPLRSLAAFEKSEYAEDWQDLMRLFMIRRTRSFIQENYASTDPLSGRQYLLLPNGTRSWFPQRIPRTLRFAVDEQNNNDPYAKLYSEQVVEAINTLNLPRYGLGNYIVPKAQQQATKPEQQILDRLSRAGRQVMGFCRTNLFKRLESGGPAFLDSIARHILRNYIFLHALETGQDILIGSQDVVALVDTDVTDADAAFIDNETRDDEGVLETLEQQTPHIHSEAEYQQQATRIYQEYTTKYHARFSWLRCALFTHALAQDLLADIHTLSHVLDVCGRWNPEHDTKLTALEELLTQKHPQEKVLIFTQFADTVQYLKTQLQHRGIPALEGVTGSSTHISEIIERFSPVSNNASAHVAPEKSIRVLLATDVLSEGQNLQDAHIVVNYDLPWAIIRLVQRAGRVDRIGQQAETITCYSFLPADGVEDILRLSTRVRGRLQENAAVVGSDEKFFEDEIDTKMLRDIYSEKASILDGETDNDIDLVSQAYQIWKNATDANPSLKQIIERLPDVVFSTKEHQGTASAPSGVLLYAKTAEGNDSVSWINEQGDIVSQSQSAILQAAACSLSTPAIPRPDSQHELVKKGLDDVSAQQTQESVGTLGNTGSIRRRLYERLKHYNDKLAGTLFPLAQELEGAINDIFNYQLCESAKDTVKRQMRTSIGDDQLVEIVLRLHAENRLCIITDTKEEQEPRIICSLGLFPPVSSTST